MTSDGTLRVRNLNTQSSKVDFAASNGTAAKGFGAQLQSTSMSNKKFALRTATKGAADADAAATNLVEADKLASAAKDAVSQANSTKFQFYVPYNASATMVALHAAKVAEVEGRVTLLRAKADFARARVALMRQNVPVGNPKAIFVEAAAIQLETHAAVDLDAAESSAARSLAMMAAANALAEVERAHRSLVHAVIRARAAHDAAGVVRAVGCCSPPRVVRSPR